MGKLKTTTIGLTALLILVSACSPGVASPTSGGGSQGPSTSSGAPAAPKVLRIALSREPNGFVISLSASASTSGGAIQAQNIPANKLQNTNEKGEIFAELAEALPSTAAGTWIVNADGTMQTTWKLRPNIKWHDGQPVTSEDLVFGFQAASDPTVPSLGAAYLRNIKEVVALDPLTAVVHWSQPVPNADAPGDMLPVLPKHILASEYAKGGEAFAQSPYWTAEFIGNGPFKLDRWLPGDQLQFSAFADYYRGRPALDRVIIRVMPDTNTQVANIMSGEIDVTLPVSLDADTALTVKERWTGTNNQVLLASPGNLRSFLPNSREDAQTTKELLDPRYRQALYRAVDRMAVSETVTRGTAQTADSFVPPFFAMRKDVESAIAQYPYDLAAAQRAFADLGWTRAPDGVLRNAQGQELRFRVTATAFGRAEREVNSAVAGWKELGIQVDQVFDPPSIVVSDEERVMRPGFGIIGGVASEFLETRLSCDTIPTPRNQFRGRNSGSWCKPEAQTFIDRLRVTIPAAERTQLIRGLVGVASTELPVMPLYWDVDPILAVAGVKNVPLPSAPTRVSTFNIWEWDKLPG